jgi:hypothetical protein
MARFMITHLNKGAFGSARILQAATAEQMHGTPLTILPRVHRMLLGFYEQNYNGRRVIGHGGDTGVFHSNLHLFIDDGVGMFISVNSAGRNGATRGLRNAIFQQFADRYLPGPTLDGAVDPQTAAEHARMISGVYDNSRRIESSFFSLLNLVGVIKVFPNEDGTISTSIAVNPAGVPIKWREVEPFVWRNVDGEDLLSAQAENGRVTRFSFDEVSPFMVFEPTPASRSPSWLLPSLGAGALALFLTTLAWPVSALVRRHYGAPYLLTGLDAKAHRWIRITSVAVLAICIAWGATVSSMMGDFDLLMPGVDGWLWFLQLLSVVVFIGAAAIGVWNATVVVRAPRKWYAKTWAVVLALSLLVFLWTALQFHLIAFDVNY